MCLAVLLVACGKKDENLSLTITVVEYGTNKPIPNVGVEVYAYESIEGRWGGRDVYYDSIVTNSQGRAFIDGSEYRPNMIRLYSPEKNYYDQWLYGAQGELQLSVVERNKNVAELIPFAWAKIRFIKESQLDYIGFNLPGEPYSYTIYTTDTLIYGKTFGNKDVELTIYPNKGGAALPVEHDSFFPLGHDTTYHEIRW